MVGASHEAKPPRPSPGQRDFLTACHFSAVPSWRPVWQRKAGSKFCAENINVTQWLSSKAYLVIHSENTPVRKQKDPFCFGRLWAPTDIRTPDISSHATNHVTIRPWDISGYYSRVYFRRELQRKLVRLLRSSLSENPLLAQILHPQSTTHLEQWSRRGASWLFWSLSRRCLTASRSTTRTMWRTTMAEI